MSNVNIFDGKTLMPGLVDGNPLENIDLVGDAEANFDLIMKDGKIYKNNL